MSARLPIAFQAFAVAMQAKTGSVDQLDVDDLITKVQQILSVDDPLAIGCTTFATQFELRPDKAALADLGQRLHSAIELALRPDPVDGHRADIYG